MINDDFNEDDAIEKLLHFINSRINQIPETSEGWILDYLENPKGDPVYNAVDFAIGFEYGSRIALEDICDMIEGNGFDLY